MTKKQLADKLAAANLLPKALSRELVQECLDLIAEALVNGERVELHDFGTLDLRDLAARRGRHPKTGATVEYPASRKVRFRPAQALAVRLKACGTP